MSGQAEQDREIVERYANALLGSAVEDLGEAIEWVKDTNTGPGSFEWACRQTGRDPEQTREMLVQEARKLLRKK